jgi:hypothetical protein
MKKAGPICSVEVERIETRFGERVELAWSGCMRVEKACLEHLNSLEFQASSAGIDLSCETKEQWLDKWIEEVSSDNEHY